MDRGPVPIENPDSDGVLSGKSERFFCEKWKARIPAEACLQDHGSPFRGGGEPPGWHQVWEGRRKNPDRAVRER